MTAERLVKSTMAPVSLPLYFGKSFLEAISTSTGVPVTTPGVDRVHLDGGLLLRAEKDRI